MELAMPRTKLFTNSPGGSIKSMETEMGEFVNKEIQEAPLPEEHNTRINQGMQNALDNLNK